MTTWSEFRQAFDEAKRTINTADNHIGDMARMISGRLKNGNISDYVLAELKRELQNYNIHTKLWSDK